MLEHIRKLEVVYIDGNVRVPKLNLGTSPAQ
jgi:hypothetical protein